MPRGRIRAHHFGEGDYEDSERMIRALLSEAGTSGIPGRGTSAVSASGVQAAADEPHVNSPETYVGYERAANFVSRRRFRRGPGPGLLCAASACS